MKERLITIALITVFGLTAFSASEHRPINAGLPLVSADYQRCVIVNPGPLKPAPRLNGDNRQREIA